MIGVSLSMCVSDIINNKVNLDDVELIFTGTMFETEDDWTNSNDIKTYYSSYWKKDPKKQKKLLMN